MLAPLEAGQIGRPVLAQEELRRLGEAQEVVVERFGERRARGVARNLQRAARGHHRRGRCHELEAVPHGLAARDFHRHGARQRALFEYHRTHALGQRQLDGRSANGAAVHDHIEPRGISFDGECPGGGADDASRSQSPVREEWRLNGDERGQWWGLVKKRLMLRYGDQMVGLAVIGVDGSPGRVEVGPSGRDRG